jgi:hypothetical protein
MGDAGALRDGALAATALCAACAPYAPPGLAEQPASPAINAPATAMMNL